jgi:uncharacterized membrane protein YgcG
MMVMQVQEEVVLILVPEEPKEMEPQDVLQLLEIQVIMENLEPMVGHWVLMELQGQTELRALSQPDFSNRVVKPVTEPLVLTAPEAEVAVAVTVVPVQEQMVVVADQEVQVVLEASGGTGGFGGGGSFGVFLNNNGSSGTYY